MRGGQPLAPIAEVVREDVLQQVIVIELTVNMNLGAFYGYPLLKFKRAFKGRICKHAPLPYLRAHKL